jgi:hypothetical protein
MMPDREFSTPDDFKAALHGIDQLASIMASAISSQ